MIGEPGSFDTLEVWERFLTHSILMPQTILYVKAMIALKKEELELDVMSGDLPPGGALIDPPGPFDTLATWEEFLAELETMPDSLDRRLTMLSAKQVIVRKKRKESGA